MIRTSLSYIANFGAMTDCLGKFPLEDTDMQKIGTQLILASHAVVQLHITGSYYAPYLRASLQAASSLIQTISKTVGDPIDPQKAISVAELAAIKIAYDAYRPVVMGELGAMDSYLVTRKGPYDTLSLLMQGELLFPSELVTKVPEAAFDAREAGKCLAYEVPTACGFHVFRATESTLRRYYSHVTGGKAAPKARSFGVYINALNQAKSGDPKVLAILKQIVDLYRNPLIHPETVLTVDDAMSIIGLTRSLITVMLAELPLPPQTTTTAIIPMMGGAN